MNGIDGDHRAGQRQRAESSLDRQVLLTASSIFWTLGGGLLLPLVVAGAVLASRKGPAPDTAEPDGDRETWRMPPLSRLAPARLTTAMRVWLGVLRCYLVAASIMVVVRVVQIALGVS
jgi:hypothetical protein